MLEEGNRQLGAEAVVAATGDGERNRPPTDSREAEGSPVTGQPSQAIERGAAGGAKASFSVTRQVVGRDPDVTRQILYRVRRRRLTAGKRARS